MPAFFKSEKRFDARLDRAMDQKKKLPVALIPAYKPEPCLIGTIKELRASGSFAGIVVVDDGSGGAFASLFEEAEALGALVLHHCTNLGKGMALRTGLNHIAGGWPDSVGVVTLDADGQHLPKDVVEAGRLLCRHPQSLVMGCRTFGKEVPLRSRVGNLFTRAVTRFLGGVRVSDTQTGLRGIPLSFIPDLLRLHTTGYDFELDMLMRSKQRGMHIVEFPIATVYAPGNATSHFHPLLDSAKIYWVFLRFNLSSLAAALTDYAVFTFCFMGGFGIEGAMAGGRLISGAFNFLVNRHFVFRSDAQSLRPLVLYALTVALFAMIACWGIDVLHEKAGLPVLMAKAVMEIVLYAFSFVVQRDVIFAPPKEREEAFPLQEAPALSENRSR